MLMWSPSSLVASSGRMTSLFKVKHDRFQGFSACSSHRASAIKVLKRWSSTQPNEDESSASSASPTSDPPSSRPFSPPQITKLLPSSPRVDAVFEKISKLSRDEYVLLSRLAIHHMGMTVYDEELQYYEQRAAAASNAAQATLEPEPEVVVAAPAKTKFDVKLLGYDDTSKIKVIKEVRAIAGLGLKEAKEFVESAPKVLQKDLSEEQAQELKQKLEAVGAQIEIL